MRYILALALLLTACPLSPPVPTLQGSILDSINAARATARNCGTTTKAAVPALAWNALLEQAADRHNRDMAAKNYFDHTSPSGETPAKRVNATGYAWRTIGENIALGQPTENAVMAAWLKSAGHCNNIMSPSFTEVAVAQFDSSQGVYWTMVLAKPK
jgi:uncharacterized protein YkwD